MDDRLYLYNIADHRNVGITPENTHSLAETAFMETYMKSFRGIPLYMDVDMEYESDSARVHTEVFGSLSNGFLIDSEALREWIPDLYFVVRDSMSRYVSWANPAFADRFPEGRNSTLIDTYPGFDTIHSLYVLKSEITNKNSKQVLTTL